MNLPINQKLIIKTYSQWLLVIYIYILHRWEAFSVIFFPVWFCHQTFLAAGRLCILTKHELFPTLGFTDLSFWCRGRKQRQKDSTWKRFNSTRQREAATCTMVRWSIRHSIRSNLRKKKKQWSRQKAVPLKSICLLAEVGQILRLSPQSHRRSVFSSMFVGNKRRPFSRNSPGSPVPYRRVFSALRICRTLVRHLAVFGPSSFPSWGSSTLFFLSACFCFQSYLVGVRSRWCLFGPVLLFYLQSGPLDELQVCRERSVSVRGGRAKTHERMRGSPDRKLIRLW